MKYPIKINYKYSNNIYRVDRWFNELPDLIATDFEVASRFTDEEKEELKTIRENENLTFEEKRVLNQYINSDGLSHPSLAVITHLSVAWSIKDCFVVVCDSDTIRSYILNKLVEIENKQLWHNSIFDFKHIFHKTNKLPKLYEDTQLLVKSLLNDANSAKDRTGLKELMGYAYGDWAIAKEIFNQKYMWEESTIRYAGIDACATYKLYKTIQDSLGKGD